MLHMKSQQESLGFLLSSVSRLMRQAFEQRIEGSLLSLAQARALVYIARNEGIRQVSLAELLEIQPISLVHLVDQLEKAELIERRPDRADRRAYQLFLTPAAAPQLAAIEQVITVIRADAFSDLGEHQSGTNVLD